MAEKIGAGQVAPVMYDYGQDKFFLQDNDDLVNPLVTATTDPVTGGSVIYTSESSLTLPPGPLDLSRGIGGSAVPIANPRLSLIGNFTTAAVSSGFAGYTWQHMITVPFAFTGVRIGLPMNLTDVSSAGGVKASIATHTNVADLSKPNGTLIPVTWGGAANPTFRAAASDKSSTVTWSDTMNITPIRRNDLGAGYMLCARVNFPAGFPACGYCDNTATIGTKLTQWASLGLPASLCYSTTDTTANAAASMTSGTATMPILFEFVGVNDVVFSACVIGDSVMQGFKSAGNVSAFERAMLDVYGTKLAVVNKGWSGSKSINYRINLTEALTSGEKYDLVVYESMSVNDPADSAPIETLIGYIKDIITAVRATGSRLILVTPFPSAAATAGGNTARAAAIRDFVYSVAGGDDIILCDMAPLHDPATYSKWATGYSADDYHPSEVGEVVMRSIIADAYRRALT